MSILDGISSIFGNGTAPQVGNGPGGTNQSTAGPDQATENATNQEENYANEGTQGFINQSLNGTNNSSALSSPDQVQQKQTELGEPQNGALATAISSKQANMYNKGQANLQTQATLNAPQQQAQATEQAEQSLYGEDQVAYQQAQLNLQQQLNNTALRNQALTGLLGGMGSLGSAVVGSGSTSNAAT